VARSFALTFLPVCGENYQAGWQVAKEIKKIDKNMPVILTTGWELMPSEEESDKKMLI
jgi:hypothetical protein